MYDIPTDAVYVCERVDEDHHAVARLERMLSTLRPRRVTRVTDAELAQVAAREHWDGVCHDARTGAHVTTRARTVIFNRFVWDEAARREVLRAHPALEILGWRPFTYRKQWNHEWCVCQPAWEVHSLNGCPHACAYCHVHQWLHVMLDLEVLVERLRAKMATIPAQQLYKYDNLSDQITLEPEYGASALLVPFFGQIDLHPPKYLLLYTKSANVDHLLALAHHGRTIVNWSLSPPTQSTRIEHFTPSTRARIEAMRKCAEAGYQVRVRFSPIIPVHDWRREYRETIQALFAAVRPDVVTLDVVGFMSPEGFLASLPVDLIDPAARATVERLAGTDRRWQKHLFPPETRAGIYNAIYQEIRAVDARVPVSLCNETFEMWEAVAAHWQPRMEPEDYACCCGPTSVPGNKWLA